MSENTRRILISCGVLLFIACVCIGALALSSAGLGAFTLFRQTSIPESLVTELAPTFTISMPSNTPAVTIAPSTLAPSQTALAASATPGLADTPGASVTPGTQATMGATATAGTTGTPAPTSTLAPDILQQMDTIQQQVLSYRQLPLKSPVIKSVLTHDQLVQNVKTDFLKNYTASDAQRDARVYFALGWLPANFDIITFEIAFQAEEVAGYYDNDTKRMYVVSDSGFHGFERWTYSHEFTHVLQDQNYDIKNGLNYSDAACKNQNDRCEGVQGLIEGDAVMSQNLWLQRFSTNQDKLDIQNFYNNLQLPVTDSAPAFFRDDLQFPYQAGLEFVQSIYDRGGYNAVNAAFKNPPVDTHQILHPDDYPNVKPVAVTLLDLTKNLGGTWKKIDNGALGEWYTYLLLTDGNDPNTRLSSSLGRSATGGWRGDAYAVYDSGASQMPVVTLVTQWDSPSDAQSFVSAFTRYGNARWGRSNTSAGVTSWQTSGAYATITQNGQKTTWILAPDPDVLQRVTTALK